jgi:hypothetical protein
VTAALESDSNKGPDAIGGKDGGDHNFVYEAGTNKKLTPSSVQARAEPDSLKQGLVGWWTFDEGTGTTTKDLSGNENDGTLVNGPIWTTGKVGSALLFNGDQPSGTTETNQQRVEINDSMSLRPQNFSINAWIYKTVHPQADNGAAIVWKGGRNEYSVEIANPYCSDIRVNAGGRWCALSYQPIEVNTWIMVTVTYNQNNTTLKLYKNGILVSQRTDISPPSYDTSKVFIGQRGDHFKHTLKGLIDEVRIYNRALSDSEIKVLYDATK